MLRARLAWVAALALAPAACDEPPCPGGCPEGQVCDAEAERCVARASDCTTTGCSAPGEVCDPLEGVCVPARDCLTEGCPEGQLCNSSTKACEQRQGCRVEFCPAGLECDLATGECRPPGCRRDGECKPGRICDGAQAQCVPGCRGAGRCPPGEVCSLALDPEAAAEGATGACVPGCHADGDCPFGQACDAAGGGAGGVGECADEPPCERNDACRPDEVCEHGACVRGPCTEGIPCPERAYCDPETGRCLPADCSDDLFEDNDDADSARRLLPQAYAHLRVCPGDADWYRVDADEGSLVEAVVRFDPLAGDVDLEAYDDDLYPLGASRGRGNPERVAVRAGADRTVLLRIHGARGAQAQYFLEISVTAAAECRDDSREDNDDFRTPAALPAGAYDDLALCPGDEDWYAVSVEAGDGLEISLSSELDPAPWLERLGPEGERESAPSMAGGRRLRLQRVESAGVHLLRVHGEAVERSTYALDLRTYPGGLPCQDDDLEDNDEPEQASPVVGRTYSSLVACPGDVDWFSVRLDRPGAEVGVELTGAGPGLPPELTLFGPEGGQASPGEDPLTARIGPTERAGDALIRVRQPADGLPAAYDLSVEVVPGPDPCADDSFEPPEGNDAAARATLLRPGAVPDLVLCPESPEDWYAIDVADGGALRLRVSGEAVSCGLRTTDGARLLQACESADGGPASAAAVGLERGRYRLRVHGTPPPSGLVYRLELEVLP